MNKTLKVVLTIIKYAVTLALGYAGGSSDVIGTL